jgi:hypothetical protein
VEIKKKKIFSETKFMSTTNNKVFLVCLVALFALVLYRTSATPLIENFWGGLPMFSPTLDVVNSRTSESIPQNNQAQLFVNPNPIINTSIMTPQDRQLLTDSLSPPESAAHKAYQQAISMPQANKNAIDTTEYYESSRKTPIGRSMIPPTYTVPGTYQSYLSPRFNSEGYNSFVKYSLPEEKYLANRADDPLTMADRIERPVVRENYDSAKEFKGNTPYQYNEIYEKQKKQGDEVASKLPVPTMASSLSAQDAPNIYTNYDRFIFSLQRNRLQGLGDPIRGDLPCVPCNPSSDSSSNVWFRPSVNVATNLRSGAINVIAGVGNVTSQQTAELQMRSLGGAKDTFAGVALPTPLQTPVNNLQAIQQAQINNLNMGNSLQLTADRNNPVSTVSTTSFP